MSENPSPLKAAKELIDQLSDQGLEASDAASRLESLVLLLGKHSPDELLKVATFLETTSKTQDKGKTLDVAIARAEAEPVKAVDPIGVEAAKVKS